MTRKIPVNKCPDPFMMNENEVNLAVVSFFNKYNIEVKSYAMNSETGIDVLGEKNGYSFIVESKGTMANNQNEYVFGHGQIKSHISAQVYYLMKQYEYSSNQSLLIMANPDIPRIRNGLNAISISLDKLRFIRFWIKENNAIEIECPEELVSIVSTLGL